MRHPHTITIDMPEDVTSTLENNVLSLTKDGETLTRNVHIPGALVSVAGNTITIHSDKANKRVIATMKTYSAHIHNMFKGLDEAFEYKLEICHVHFPMTCKVEGSVVSITNFLGEKKPRSSKIMDGVTVDIKGQNVTVTGRDLEKTGQTAANLELATKVPKKDRRIFQDGIFITHKPRGAI